MPTRIYPELSPRRKQRENVFSVLPDLSVPARPWHRDLEESDVSVPSRIVRSGRRRMTMVGRSEEGKDDEYFNREEEASIQSEHSAIIPQTATVLQHCSTIRVVRSTVLDEGPFMFFNQRSMRGKVDDFDKGVDMLFEKIRDRENTSQFPVSSVSGTSYIFVSHTRGVPSLLHYNEAEPHSSSLVASYRREKVAALKLLPELLQTIGSVRGLEGCQATRRVLSPQPPLSPLSCLLQEEAQAAYLWIDAYGLDQSKLTPAGGIEWPMMSAKSFINPIQHASHMAVLVSPTYFKNLYTLLELVLWSELHGKRFELPNLLFLPVGWPFKLLTEKAILAMREEGENRLGAALSALIIDKLQADLTDFSESTITELFIAMTSDTEPKDKAAEFSRMVDSLYGTPGRTLWERKNYASEDQDQEGEDNPFSTAEDCSSEAYLSRMSSSEASIVIPSLRKDIPYPRPSAVQRTKSPKRRRGGFMMKSKHDRNRVARSASISLVCRVQSLAVKLLKAAKLPHNVHLMELYFRRRLLDSACLLRFMSTIRVTLPFETLKRKAWTAHLEAQQTSGLADINAPYSKELALLVAHLDSADRERTLSARSLLSRLLSKLRLNSHMPWRAYLGDVPRSFLQKKLRLANVFAQSMLLGHLVEAGAQLGYGADHAEDLLSILLLGHESPHLPPPSMWIVTGLDPLKPRPVHPNLFQQLRDPRLPLFQVLPRELWLNFLDAAVFFRMTELTNKFRRKGFKHSPTFLLLLMGELEATQPEGANIYEKAIELRGRSFDSINPVRLMK